MRANTGLCLVLCLLCLSLLPPSGNAISSTIHKPQSSSVEKNTPHRESSYYNDTFDKLRDDIWKESRIVPHGPQVAPLMPDIRITDGELRIETRTGDFSTGGLVSKYTLRGGFDIQVDCHMDFLEKAPKMDQVLLFAVRETQKGEWTAIGLSRKAHSKSGIFSLYWQNGKVVSPKWHRCGNFRGSLRIVRTGSKITTLYMKEGKTEWERLLTSHGIRGEVVLGFGLKNFISQRTTIQARSPVVASFDNFRINAAQEIIKAETVPSTGTTDCDKAQSVFWEGKFSSSKEEACRYYLEAVEMCPGFIRPYELIGNYYRKKGNKEKAIEFFTKAAQLGSNNYKLYYLLASLLFQERDLDEASRYLNKSLDIRGDYPRSLNLKTRIDSQKDTEGPRIILYEPSTRRGLNIVCQEENISVRGIATDKSGVSWVKVNEFNAPLDKHGNFLKDIRIQVGSNTIIVEAADGLGNKSKVSVTVEGKKYALPPMTKVDASQSKKLYEKSFAIVIGIDDYEKWPLLEFAVNDARAIREKLEETGFDHITIILDKEATQRRILTELFHELPKKVGRNDRVVFYFAGHGQTEELPKGGKRGYIIPVDAEMSHYSATAISMDQIRSLSSRIPAKHILYAMDSCYSGLGLNRSAGVSPKISDYLRKISSMRVVQVITAGGKGEQVQEKAGHGLFTTYFLRALEGEADFNKDNVVTGTELGAYLRPTVSNASGQAQTPLYGRLEGEGEFLFFVGQK